MRPLGQGGALLSAVTAVISGPVLFRPGYAGIVNSDIIALFKEATGGDDGFSSELPIGSIWGEEWVQN